MSNKTLEPFRKVNRHLKTLHCLPKKGMFGGVCAGVAYRLGVPTWIVRLNWVLLSWFYGTGVLAYLLLWIFVPNQDDVPSDYGSRTGDR
jgi:phage shock protein PspC (stress-responsive transcriptional regulator)